MTIYFLETVHERLAERLTAAGHTCIEAFSVQRADVLAGQISDAHGLVVRSRFHVDAPLLAALPELRFIARSGSGLENIDLPTAAFRNVAVYNSPEGNRVAVGEHTLGMLLALLHKLHVADRSVRAGAWLREAHRGLELSGRTVGIIGFGQMGSAFAQRLQGFECRILAYDKYRTDWPAQPGLQAVDEATLLAESDVISLHLPLTDETHHLVSSHWLQRLGKSPMLINTSRGPIASTGALAEGLQRGWISGAALDVLEEEGRDLLNLTTRSEALEALAADPRVIFSPHVAGWTQESYFKLSDVLADKVLTAFPQPH
jgi:D-3-phosphoglycerate dehydrogenase